MKEIVRLGLVLMVIGAVAAGVLTVTNSVTAPVIAGRLESEKVDALRIVYPAAEDFRDLGGEIGDLLGDPRFSGIISEAWAALAGGEEIGAVYVVTPTGYGGHIVTLVGIDADSQMVGIHVLTATQETPGLGLEVVKPWFTGQFAGKELGGDLAVTKTAPERPHEIQAVTAATISSAAVVTGVNAAAAFHRARMEESYESASGSRSRDLAGLLPGAEEFKDITEASDAALAAAGVREYISEVWIGKSGRDTVGYAFLATTRGFGGAVISLVGFDAHGVVVGVRVLSMVGEAEGMGTKAGEEEFLKQFLGLRSAAGASFARPSAGSADVVAVSGATLSSRAVHTGVSAAMTALNKLLAGGGA